MIEVPPCPNVTGLPPDSNVRTLPGSVANPLPDLQIIVSPEPKVISLLDTEVWAFSDLNVTVLLDLKTAPVAPLWTLPSPEEHSPVPSSGRRNDAGEYVGSVEDDAIHVGRAEAKELKEVDLLADDRVAGTWEEIARMFGGLTLDVGMGHGEGARLSVFGGETLEGTGRDDGVPLAEGVGGLGRESPASIGLAAVAERPELVTGCLATPLGLVAGGLLPGPVGNKHGML